MQHDPRATASWSVRDVGGGRAWRAYQSVVTQPNWVVRAALMTFLAIIAIFAILVFVFAVIPAVVIFAILAGINRLIRRVKGDRGPDDHLRENVRVVRRPAE